ncbi:MAG: nucleotidyltransferase family protein [Alphaproteobacteria bacterium]
MARVRRGADGALEFLAPVGLHDLFAMVVRPNLLSASPQTRDRQCARWATVWPDIAVIPWPVAAQTRARS